MPATIPEGAVQPRISMNPVTHAGNKIEAERRVMPIAISLAGDPLVGGAPGRRRILCDG
jgi:hypothetical protein